MRPIGIYAKLSDITSASAKVCQWISSSVWMKGYADILNLPLGYQIRYRDVRIKFIRRFPYGIHYLVEPGHIIIIAVFHTSKSPSKWFNRLKGN